MVFDVIRVVFVDWKCIHYSMLFDVIHYSMLFDVIRWYLFDVYSMLFGGRVDVVEMLAADVFRYLFDVIYCYLRCWLMLASMLSDGIRKCLSNCYSGSIPVVFDIIPLLSPVIFIQCYSMLFVLFSSDSMWFGEFDNGSDIYSCSRKQLRVFVLASCGCVIPMLLMTADVIQRCSWLMLTDVIRDVIHCLFDVIRCCIRCYVEHLFDVIRWWLMLTDCLFGLIWCCTVPIQYSFDAGYCLRYSLNIRCCPDVIPVLSMLTGIYSMLFDVIRCYSWYSAFAMTWYSVYSMLFGIVRCYGFSWDVYSIFHLVFWPDIPIPVFDIVTVTLVVLWRCLFADIHSFQVLLE
jgi:hypothetical protein